MGTGSAVSNSIVKLINHRWIIACVLMSPSLCVTADESALFDVVYYLAFLTSVLPAGVVEQLINSLQ